jgi:DNA-binding transcriptional LysR family regulator
MNNYEHNHLELRTMDLTDLHIFRSVVQAGGVTRAAEKLNRVQSNVTTRVRQLESELGVELFVREGKKLHLSSEGKLLLDYADRLLDLAQEAREAVHDAEPRGVLRLGTGESTAAMRLPVPMNEYLRRYPEVTLELRTGNTRELAAAVLGGDLDAALVSEPIADAPFDKVAIYEEELVIIAAAGHAPIKSPRDARPQTVLAFESGCSYRQRLEDWFAHHGEMPDRIVEIASYHAMLGCVVAGMGISLMPRNVLTTFPDAKLLSVHSLPPALAHAPTCLIRRKGTLSPKVSALIEVLLAHSDRGKKTARDSQERAWRSQPRLTAAPDVKSSDCTRRPRDACATRRRSP